MILRRASRAAPKEAQGHLLAVCPDCVLAVTRKDNVNLMVAQVAKVVYKVPKVIARVYDPEREEVYSQFGIETISPTSLTAKAFLRALSSAEGENGS